MPATSLSVINRSQRALVLYLHSTLVPQITTQHSRLILSFDFFALGSIEFALNHFSCKVEITIGLLKKKEKYLAAVIKQRNCLLLLVLYNGYLSVIWTRAFLFFYWGECCYSMYFYFSTSPIYILHSIYSLVWNAILVILSDKHNVANHAVLKLTATLCQVWWYIALTIIFCSSIKRYTYCNIWVWSSWTNIFHLLMMCRNTSKVFKKSMLIFWSIPLINVSSFFCLYLLCISLSGQKSCNFVTFGKRRHVIYMLKLQ